MQQNIYLSQKLVARSGKQKQLFVFVIHKRRKQVFTEITVTPVDDIRILIHLDLFFLLIKSHNGKKAGSTSAGVGIYMISSMHDLM